MWISRKKLRSFIVPNFFQFITFTTVGFDSFSEIDHSSHVHFSNSLTNSASFFSKFFIFIDKQFCITSKKKSYWLRSNDFQGRGDSFGYRFVGTHRLYHKTDHFNSIRLHSFTLTVALIFILKENNDQVTFPRQNPQQTCNDSSLTYSTFGYLLRVF